MALPPSFRSEFPEAFASKFRFRRVLIGTEGRANTGKTEFLLSGPGPGIALTLDASEDAVLSNPTPPPTRSDNFLFVPVHVAMPVTSTQKQGQEAWAAYWRQYAKALDNPDARTIGIDGDSDSFELQMLAEFGRVTQIPQIQRTNLNAARRAYIKKARHCGKIVVMTNKVKRKYETVFDAQGNPKLDEQGKFVRDWNGRDYERQGFNDYEYLYEIQLKHLYDADRGEWGIAILMCKAQRALEGTELWGDDCNMRTLLELVYPQFPLSEWGY